MYNYQDVGAVDFSGVNYYKGRFFGTKNVTNRTGVSFITKLSVINYYFSLLNDWKIYSYGCSGYSTSSPSFSRFDETTSRGDVVTVKMGVEFSLFVDWIVMRLSFDPLQMSYNEVNYYQEQSGVGNNDRYVFKNIFIFPLQFSTIGFGVNIGDDMKIDLDCGNADLYKYEDTTDSHMEPTDIFLKQFSLNLEFTMRFR